jgi:hypothetical protein
MRVFGLTYPAYQALSERMMISTFPGWRYISRNLATLKLYILKAPKKMSLKSKTPNRDKQSGLEDKGLKHHSMKMGCIELLPPRGQNSGVKLLQNQFKTLTLAGFTDLDDRALAADRNNAYGRIGGR